MRTRTTRATLLLFCLALLLPACSSVDGRRLLDSARTQDAPFFVEHQPKDPRHLEVLLAESLQARGVTTTPQRDEAAYIVTYVDRWNWDMRMFLREFSIEVEDAHTQALVGSGRSRQDSLAALGMNFRDVIDRAVAAMFDGK